MYRKEHEISCNALVFNLLAVLTKDSLWIMLKKHFFFFQIFLFLKSKKKKPQENIAFLAGFNVVVCFEKLFRILKYTAEESFIHEHLCPPIDFDSCRLFAIVDEIFRCCTHSSQTQQPNVIIIPVMMLNTDSNGMPLQ